MTYKVSFHVVTDKSHQSFTLDYDGDTKNNAEWMRLRLKEALEAVANGATVSTSWEQITELM